MPTGYCTHPAHRTGPPVWPVLALIAAIAVAAIVISQWHQIAVTLAVIAVMILAVGAVMVLWHRHHPEPDNAVAEPTVIRAEVEAVVLRGRVDQLERQLAAEPRRQIEAAPVIHNHLHLHGDPTPLLRMIPDETQELLRRELPAITKADHPRAR